MKLDFEHLIWNKVSRRLNIQCFPFHHCQRTIRAILHGGQYTGGLPVTTTSGRILPYPNIPKTVWFVLVMRL
jgi:hypothetical protein